jgi:hypothetical protein
MVDDVALSEHARSKFTYTFNGERVEAMVAKVASPVGDGSQS